jgi:hypothetical protein
MVVPAFAQYTVLESTARATAFSCDEAIVVGVVGDRKETE